MPWVKFSDDWYDDPKVIAAGDDGGWLYVVAISWCARNLTDGRIPTGQIPRLTTLPEAPTVAARLVELDLFRQVDDGYEVVNYHRFQPTRAEVLAKREAEAERGRARRASGAASARTPAGPAAESGDRPTPPVPVPDPVGKPSSSSALPVGSTDELSTVSAVLDLVAETRLRAQTGVRNPTAWLKRCRANLDEELASDALEAVRTWEEPPHVLAAVLTGERDKRWLKRKAVAS